MQFNGINPIYYIRTSKKKEDPLFIDCLCIQLGWRMISKRVGGVLYEGSVECSSHPVVEPTI